MAKPLAFKEMALDDLLSDPMVALVMLSDGIAVEAVRNQMHAIQRRLKARLSSRRA